MKVILETTWIIMVFYVHNKIQNIEKGDNFLLTNSKAGIYNLPSKVLCIFLCVFLKTAVFVMI